MLGFHGISVSPISTLLATGAIAWTLSLSDTVTLTDDNTKSVSTTQADTIVLSDDNTKSVSTTQADTIVLSDDNTKSVSVEQTDTIVLSDAIAKKLSRSIGGVSNRAFPVDSLITATKRYYKNLSDDVTLSDAIVKDFDKVFDCTPSLVAWVLVVGGGGSGGSFPAQTPPTLIGGQISGGGGGGVVGEFLTFGFGVGTYPITVGAGAAAGSFANGGDSIIGNTFPITPYSQGGGGGGWGYKDANGVNGLNGGTGGGGANQSGVGGTGSGAGGSSLIDPLSGDTPLAGGGGGAAPMDGGSTDNDTLLDAYGGDGYTSAIYPAYASAYGGGGGGGWLGTAGLGGGAAGTYDATGNNAADGFGGGGGGTGSVLLPYNGGAGGSGVVIIRYNTASYPVGCTGGTIIIDGTDTIHLFTADGDFVVRQAACGDTGTLTDAIVKAVAKELSDTIVAAPDLLTTAATFSLSLADFINLTDQITLNLIPGGSDGGDSDGGGVKHDIPPAVEKTIDLLAEDEEIVINLIKIWVQCQEWKR